MDVDPYTPSTPLSRAYRLGAEARAMTIAAWLRTLVDWNVSLDRAADWIEAGVYKREDEGCAMGVKSPRVTRSSDAGLW